MKTSNMLCLSCGKFLPHTSYSEQRTIIYMGVEVDYNECGWICSVCGEEQQTMQQFDDSLAEIKETYNLLKKG